MIRGGGAGLGKSCLQLWSLSHSGFPWNAYYSRLLPFPTELFIVNTVVCDEVHTGMKYTSSKAKLCSWVYYESIDFCSFHSVLPLSDYQENSFNHDHLRNFSLRVICQAVISRFLLDAFNRSKDSSKSRHLQGDSYSSSASFCSHHHHLASFFILSLLLIFSATKQGTTSYGFCKYLLHPVSLPLLHPHSWCCLSYHFMSKLLQKKYLFESIPLIFHLKYCFFMPCSIFL